MTKAVGGGGGRDGGGTSRRMGSLQLLKGLSYWAFVFYNFLPVYYILLLENSSVNSQTVLRPGTYGDRCSMTNACQKNAMLQCVNNFCQCSGPDEIFDNVRERCAVQEGKRCTPPPFQYGEYNPCVVNAYCSVEKKRCLCAKHTFPDDRGHCLKKRFYNETCSADKNCDDSKYLSCVDGLCLCERSSMFDDYYQICKRKVGDFCLRTRDCVKHATCVNSKCVCNPKYIENSDKTCALDYGQSCGGSAEEFPCSDTYYACINGMCQCKNPSYEVYDRRTGSCLSLVGGLCHLFMSNNGHALRLKNCVPNAECVRRENSALSQCECEKGFIETVSGMCQLPFGAACLNNTQSFDALTRCDQSVPLVCKSNNRCDCENSNDVYDSVENTCRRMVGTQCSPSSSLCVANSQCENGRCRCLSGFLPNFRGLCEEDDNKILPQHQIFDVISPPPSYTMYRSTPIFE